MEHQEHQMMPDPSGRDQGGGEGKNRKKEQEIQERRRKYVSILISVIIAIGLWFFVINDENPTIRMTYSDIEIDYLNEDLLQEEGLVVKDSDIPVTVKVVLQGKRTDLLAIKSSDITATADVSQCTKGDNYVDVEVHTPSSSTVSSVKPAQVRLTIESLVSRQKDVRVVFNGTAPDSTEAVCESISPEQIVVTGASSSVASVKNLRAVVNISDVGAEETTLDVSLTPVDESGNEVTDVTLSSETARITVRLYATKTVPLVVETVGTSDPELDVSVEALELVEISCPEDRIDEVIEVTAEPVDITGITELTEISLTPLLPEGVQLTSGKETVPAVIRVEKRPSKIFEYASEDVERVNLPDGMTAEILDDTVTLTVYGEDLSDLTDSDFTLQLDCSGLGEEESQVTLTVLLSEKAEDQDITPKAPAVSVLLKEDEESGNAAP